MPLIHNMYILRVTLIRVLHSDLRRMTANWEIVRYDRFNPHHEIYEINFMKLYT